MRSYSASIVLSIYALAMAPGCEIFKALGGGEGSACQDDEGCPEGMGCVEGVCEKRMGPDDAGRRDSGGHLDDRANELSDSNPGDINSTPDNAHIDDSAAFDLVARDSAVTFDQGAYDHPGDDIGVHTPVMAIEPSFIDFGVVNVDGLAASRTLTATNVGTGTLEITRVFIEPPTGSAMSVSPELTPLDDPILLEPSASQLFDVTYDPTSIGSAVAILYLWSNDTVRHSAGDVVSDGVGIIELKGDSRGPPEIQVSTPTIDFGQVNLGQSAQETLTVLNTGSSDLTIRSRMTILSSSDFRYTPPTQSVIQPGSSADLNIIYEPSQLNEVSGTFQIENSDPEDPIVSINLHGFGLSSSANDTIKVEMRFENGDDGFYNEDFRDINLYLESPLGEVCDKANPSPDWTHGGSNDQINFGHPRWSSVGVQNEPETVALFDAHEDASGVFKFCVLYREDCRLLPLDVLAGSLGIGVRSLSAGLEEGIVMIDSGDVAAKITEGCWEHSSSMVLLLTFVNGQQVAQHSVRLASKGDIQCLVSVEKSNGTYCVEGASPPQVGCP